MRFLADMGVSSSTVNWLQSKGHDAKHHREESLQKLSDKDIFRRQQRKIELFLLLTLILVKSQPLQAQHYQVSSYSDYRMKDQ